MVVSRNLKSHAIAIDRIPAPDHATRTSWRSLINHRSVEAQFSPIRARQELAARADLHSRSAFHDKCDAAGILPGRNVHVVFEFAAAIVVDRVNARVEIAIENSG